MADVATVVQPSLSVSGQPHSHAAGIFPAQDREEARRGQTATPKRTHHQAFRINYTCIPDRRVPPRARASLPSVLQLVGGRVLTRRALPANTRFGPVQGVRRVVTLDEAAELSQVATTEKRPLFLLTDSDHDATVHIDLSDEDNSNWLHYLRTAQPGEANLRLKQWGSELYVVAPRQLKPRAVLGLPNSCSSVASLLLPENEKTLGEGRCEREATDVEEEGEGWRCHECGQLCETSQQLHRHWDTHHPPDGSATDGRSVRKRRRRLTCPYCSRGFTKLFWLNRHIKTHLRKSLQRPLLPTENRNKRYERTDMNMSINPNLIENRSLCNITNILNINAARMNAANYFQDFTENDLVSEYIVPQLTEATLSDAGRREGEVGREEGGGRGGMVCLLCHNSAITRKDHHQHTETHRQSDGMFYCVHCDKPYGAYVSVMKHIKSKHVPARYVCLHCKLTFTQSSACISHLLTHTDVKQYVCECGKAFKRKQKLKEHVAKKHSNGFVQTEMPAKTIDLSSMPFICRMCQIGFKRRGMLVNHLARSHPGQPMESVPELASPIVRSARYYHCTHCTRVYRSVAKRKKHFLSHHPGEPMPSSLSSWVCPRAPQTFAPQQCPACHRQYSARSRLNRHIREAHPHLVPPSISIPDSKELILETVATTPPAYASGDGEAPTYPEALAPTAATILFLAADQHALLCQQGEETVTLALEVLPAVAEVGVGADAFAAEALTYLQFPPPPYHAACSVPSDSNYSNTDSGVT